ncbi:MAG TPA: hypothetical protein ENK83_08335 [Aliiroseovarius sp.]|nr:hypothetical protein [Aliiroseovarius sp.]
MKEFFEGTQRKRNHASAHAVFAALLAGLVGTTAAISAAAQDVEGYYYEGGNAAACADPYERRSFIDNVFQDQMDIGCRVISAEPVDGWTRVNLACTADEGGYFNTTRKVRIIDSGLEFEHDGRRWTWTKCAQAPSVLREEGKAPSNHRWVSGFGMGVSVARTYDDFGNDISVSCAVGVESWKPLGSIFFQIGNKSPAPGAVTFVIDGRQFNMEMNGPGNVDISDCNACRANYDVFRAALAAGNLLTIIPPHGPSARFSLAGSREALSAGGDLRCYR